MDLKKVDDIIGSAREKLLTDELVKNVERKTRLEIEIALQKELDPEETSARRPLKYDQDGRAISWESIKRKEHIEILVNELEAVELRINVLKNI